MSTSILLCVAVASPTAGRLSDIFGRRNFLLLGNISGIASCIIAVTVNAASTNIIIGAGGLIGIASSQHQLAWAGLVEVVPRRSRG
jgi:MFS family permease